MLSDNRLYIFDKNTSRILLIRLTEQNLQKANEICRDSLSEISNCSLDLYKSPSVGADLCLPPLKDSAPYLCTLALHPGLCTLFCTLYHGAGTFSVPVG
jgi:hypothetical protein